MNNYQLYRTNILLGGQMKYDLVADLVDGDVIINDIHITPISDNLPYNKLSDENLLNYDNQENIKNFYTGNLGLGISMTALTVMDILLYKGNRRLYK